MILFIFLYNEIILLNVILIFFKNCDFSLLFIYLDNEISVKNQKYIF